ncbi:MAG: hypothetical protein AAFP19_02405 [Bacteroidota bacterium]
MKKVIVLFTCLLLVSLSSSAQDYSVDWGQVYRSTGNLHGYKLISADEDGYYMQMRLKKEGSIRSYDWKHKKLGEVKLNLKAQGDDVQFIDLVYTAKGKFVCAADYNKKAKEWILMSSLFEPRRLGAFETIHRHPYKKKKALVMGVAPVSMDLNRDKGNEFVVSPDKKMVAYMNVLANQNEAGNQKMAIALFDADMKLQWDKVHEFPYKDMKLDVQELQVGNDGTVYIFTSLKDKSTKKKDKNLSDAEYIVFQLSDSGVKETRIKIGSTKTPELAMMSVSSGSPSYFRVAGLYSSTTNAGLVGHFNVHGEVGGGLKETEAHFFKDAFKEGLVEEKRLKKGKGLEYNYYIKDDFELPDGSTGFIIEQIYQENKLVNTTTGAGHLQRNDTKNKVTYHSDNLLILCYDAEGKLKYEQKIIKDFEINTEYSTSYAYGISDSGKLYFLFNDTKTKEERKKLNGKKRMLYTDLAIINEKGQLAHRELLFKGSDVKLDFTPLFCDFAGNQFLVGNFRLNQYTFGTLEMK